MGFPSLGYRAWGTVAVADVDTLAVETWVAALSTKSGGTATVLRAHGVLSGILADAVKGKRLAANPCKGIENLPRKTGKRRVYLSPEDVGRLAVESGQHRALVLVLAYCGIRWGEAVALRVRDVQLALDNYLTCGNRRRNLAVAEGFEPSDGVSRHTLSRRAP